MRAPLAGTLLVTQLMGSLRGGPGEAYNACHGQICERCRAHAGLDLNCPVGTPVYAMKAGVIRFFGPPWGFPDGGYAPLGLYAVVALPGGEEQWYCHLSAAIARTSMTVAAGEQIALSGATGNVSGPHLHLGLRPATPNYGNGFDGFEPLMTHWDADVQALLDFSLV